MDAYAVDDVKVERTHETETNGRWVSVSFSLYCEDPLRWLKERGIIAGIIDILPPSRPDEYRDEPVCDPLPSGGESLIYAEGFESGTLKPKGGE